MKWLNLFILKTCISVLMCLLCAAIAAQPINSALNVVEPSTPNSASLLKYSDIPVSHFTGVPNINIPLHTVIDGELKLPISLSYHSAGIRVAETASKIGLGWTLQAGGMVSRMVRSRQDDAFNGYYSNSQDQLTISNILNDSSIDTEPDIFTFNFNGYSGKFIFKKDGSIEILDDQDLKISVYYGGQTLQRFQRFTIITPDGNKYYFGLKQDGQFCGEKTKIITDDSVAPQFEISSWYLYRVESFDGKYSIDLNYEDELFTFTNLGSCRKVKILSTTPEVGYTCSTNAQKICTGVLTGLGNKRIIRTIVDGKRLTSISSSSSVVSFIKGANTRLDLNTGDETGEVDVLNAFPLEKIRITEGNYLSEYIMHHSYFRDPSEDRPEYYRLRLDSMIQTSGNLSPKLYLFEYWGESDYMINRLSYQQDFWGFWNGKTGNEDYSDMIPKQYVNIQNNMYSLGESDRSAFFNSSAAKNGLLKKITYPTKGTESFDYEQHTVEDEWYTVEVSQINGLNTCVNSIENCCSSNSNSETLNFTADQSNSINILLKGNPDNECTESALIVTIHINGVSQVLPVNNLWMSIPFNELYGSNPLPNTDYVITLESEGGEATARVMFNDTTFYQNRPIGGQRIKTIETYDGLGNVKTRSFNYDKSPNTSSGKTFIDFFGNISMNFLYEEGGTLNTYVSTDYPLVSLGGLDGLYIGYSQVTEKVDNASIVHKFDLGSQNPVSFPHIPNHDTEKGALKLKENRSGETLLSSENYVYNYINNAIPNTCFAVQEFTCPASDVLHEMAFIKQYQPKLSRREITSVTRIKDGVQSKSTYFYDDSNTIQPTLINTKTPEGTVYGTSYKYPSSYDPITSILLEQNRLTPVVTAKLVNGEFVDRTRTLYSFFDESTGAPSNTGIGPFKHTILRNEVTWVDGQRVQNLDQLQVTYNKYDVLSSKPKEATVDGWKKMTFDWDATNGLLLTKNYENHSESYTYKPGTRLLDTHTKIDGTSVTYDYDGFSRLKSITDNERNVKTTYLYNYGNPTLGLNFVKSTTIFPPSPPDSELEEHISTQFFDGLGRSILTVDQGKGSNINMDVFSMLNYDSRGRIVKSFEPFELNTGNGFINPYGADNQYRPHTFTIYDDLNRPTVVDPPNLGITKYDYGTNDTPIYGYGPSSLFATHTYDPQGRETVSFTDVFDKKIMDRKKGSNDLDVFYKYDDKERLTEIVPFGSNIGNTNLNYIYSYTGDDMIKTKTTPDKGREEFWYDSRNLQTHYQDPNLKNENKYLASRYDDYGREVASGFTTTTDLMPEVDVEQAMTTDNILSATKYGSLGIKKGKVEKEVFRSILPDGSIGKGKSREYNYDGYGRVESILSKFFKENGNQFIHNSTVNSYDFADNVLKNTVQLTLPGEVATVVERYKINKAGRLTSFFHKYNGNPEQRLANMDYTHRGQVKNLNYGGSGSNYLTTLFHQYQENGYLTNINAAYAAPISPGEDPIDPVIGLPILGAINSNTISLYHLGLKYFNDGNISMMTNQINGKKRHIYGYTYDTYSRLKSANYVAYPYNGPPVDRNRYNTSYSYDLQGNLYSITRNGFYVNMSTGEWKQGVIDQLSLGYELGDFNKLKSVTDYAPEASVMEGVHPRGNNKDIEYDSNGNMLTIPHQRARIKYNYMNLPRKTEKVEGEIDWVYTSDGQLFSKQVKRTGNVVEKKDYVESFELIDSKLAQINHAYGRLTPNKNCMLSNDIRGSFRYVDYNYYGTVIDISGRASTSANLNLHASKGAVLYKPLFSDNSASVNVINDGSCQYTNWIYEYAIRDHLGNTRLMFSDDDRNGTINESEIKSEFHYYPFGMEHAGAWQNKPRRDYKYRYNGKEIVNDHGLGMYLYGARVYLPEIGRFSGVDPLADQAPGWTPYRYGFNSPLRFSDPTGNFEVDEVDGDYYDNKGNYIGTDGIDDGKIYVVNSSDFSGCSGMSCLDLKSVSTEVQISTAENKQGVLSEWAREYQGLSNRYSNDSKGDREFAMSLYSGIINSKSGRQEVFAIGNTIKGRKGIDGISLSSGKSPIDGWNATETIHTHRWGSNSGAFSDDPGYIPGDVQTSLKTGNQLYLVVPYSNYIGSFNPSLYNKSMQKVGLHSSAKRFAINPRAIKIQ